MEDFAEGPGTENLVDGKVGKRKEAGKLGRMISGV